MNPKERRLLTAAFFLTGAAGLALEVAWFKELSFILGNTTYAISTVVAAYMGGLGLGAAVASKVGSSLRRPIRAYALCEAGVGLFALCSIPLFRSTRPLFEAMYGQVGAQGGGFLLLRFLTVLVLLAPSVLLMGMSLPLVVGALSRGKAGHTFEAGWAYGVNTIGAVAGTALGGFLLLPALGIRHTAVAVGLLDLGLAVLLWWLDGRVGEASPPQETQPKADRGGTQHRGRGTGDRTGPSWNGLQWLSGGVFAASGFLAMVYEVAWFRLLGLSTGPSVFAFSAMLTVYLAGLGLGSAVAAKWVGKARVHGGTLVSRLEVVLGLVGLAGLYYFNALPAMYESLFGSSTAVLGALGPAAAHLLLSAAVVLLPCLVMGALFPAAVRALEDFGGKSASPEVEVGRLYALNTLGGIAGSLVAGFWLLPAWGLWRGLLAAGIGSLVLGALVALAVSWPHLRSAWRVAAALGLGLSLAFGAPHWDATGLNQGKYRQVYSGRATQASDSSKLLSLEEGVNTLVAVYNHQGAATLHIMGKPDASTSIRDTITQSTIGHLPLFFSDSPRRVAVVGYGSGMTAGAVLAHPEVESLDLVEIEKAVVSASPFFSCVNGDPPSDPRCRFIYEDARVFFAYSRGTYDVVISEPSNPWLAGVANLFTVDYYRQVRQRMRPGGIFCSWIQTYETSEQTFKTVLASIREVFPHNALFQIHGDMVIVSSDAPLVAPWHRVERSYGHENVSAQLARVGIREPMQFCAYFRGTDDAVDTYIADESRRSTDDNVWLEHDSVRNLLRSRDLDAGWASWETGLAGVGGAQRLGALAALFPGLDLRVSTERQLSFMYGADPVFNEYGEPIDIWARYRPILVEDMKREVGKFADLGMAAELGRWVSEGEAHRTALERAGELLENLPEEPGARLARIREARQTAPDYLAAIALEGDYLISVRRDYNAAEPFYQAIEARPDNVNHYSALVNLGHIALLRTLNEKRDLWSVAEGYYRRAIRFNPYFPRAFGDLAHYHTLREEPRKAREALQEGLRTNPDDPMLLQKLKALAP